MTGSGPVGVGVIGAGTISEQYLANMRRSRTSTCASWPTSARSSPAAQAEQFGVPAYGTVEQALAATTSSWSSTSPSPPRTPRWRRPRWRPASTSGTRSRSRRTWRRARRWSRRRDAAGLLLGTAPDTFLGPGLQTVRRLIEAGDIGTPLTASVVMQYAGPHRWHPNPDFLYQPGAGPLFDMGPYYLTALAQTFGPVTRVAARGAGAGPTRIIGAGPRAGEEIPVAVPTYVAALYDFEAGGVAQATFSFDSPLRADGGPRDRGHRGDARRARPEQLRRRGPDRPGGTSRESIPRDRRGGRPRDRRGRHGPGDPDRRRAIAPRAGSACTSWKRCWPPRRRSSPCFVAIASRFEPVPALPADWDPTERTL